MTGCDTLRDDLKAYLDGELPLARRFAIRRHLASCPSCREEADTMADIANEMRAGDEGAMSASLRARILDGVGGEPAPESSVPETRPVWRRPLTLWGAAAAAVLCWFLFYPLLSHLGGGGADLSPAASVAGTEQAKSASAPAPGSPQDYDERVAMGGPGGAMAARGPMGGTGGDPATRGWPGDAGDGSVRQYNPAPMAAASPPEMRAQAMKRAYGARSATPMPSAVRYVRKEASITVDVAGLEAKAETVEQMVKDAGGFVEQNSLSTGADGLKSASLTLRVPVGQFEGLLKRIAGLGSVTGKNVTGQDITEQVSDDKAASDVLAHRVQEAQRAVLGGRSEAVDRAQVELAQAKARLELSKRLAALSTITAELHEKPKTRVNSGGFVDDMGDTGRSAVNSFMAAARVPVVLLIWALAYSPVWVPLAIAYRYASRAQRRRVAAREAREWRATRGAEGVKA